MLVMKLRKILLLSRLAVVAAAALLAACSGLPQEGELSLSVLGLPEKEDQSVNLELGQVLYKGEVSEVSSERVRIDDLEFLVDDQTNLPAGLAVGSLVEVRAIALPDRTRYAVEVRLSDNNHTEESGSRVLGQGGFEYYGVVQSVEPGMWQVSDQPVQIDPDAKIEQGIAVGDIVKVKGMIVAGVLVGHEIEREDDKDFADDLPSAIGTPSPGSTATAKVTLIAATSAATRPAPSVFPLDDETEIFGVIEAINGSTWVINGQTITVGPGTEIKGTLLQVGDQVKVHFIALSDGTLRAHEIEKEDKPDSSDKSSDDSDQYRSSEADDDSSKGYNDDESDDSDDDENDD